MKTAEEIKIEFANRFTETDNKGYTVLKKVPPMEIIDWLHTLFQFHPTVTDEEIDRRAEKFADDWEELGYSRENAYDYFKSGAKWMQSRLSQPVRETYNEMFSRAVKQLTVGMNDETVGSFRAQIEHDANMMINGVKMFSQSQPVTGYSEEDIREAIRIHIPDSATIEFRGLKYVGSKIDAIIQSLKSKPNNSEK